MALDDGVPAEVPALVRVVDATADQVGAALLAVQAYCVEVAKEQVQHQVVSNLEVPVLGTRLGPFLLDAVLGQGGMGVVYRARQTTLGDRTVALKVLPRELAARDPRFVDRFRREATLAAAIHHPNLAEVYGFEADGDTLCFAMRLVEGPTLHDVLVLLARRHTGPVRPSSHAYVRRCVLVARGVADALAEIHARGLVHRDVKPSNILLEHADRDPEGALLAQPVLVDFGLLRPAGDTSLTGTKTLLGTPAYASHDSMLGRDLDASADVFSLAATLHDLLTSTSPETRGAATAGLPDVRRINPTVDARLAAVLTMALQERKGLRYEHGGAFRDELDRWLRGDTLRAVPTGTLGRVRLWARRNPARAARAGAVALLPVLLAGGLLAWFATLAVSLSAKATEAASREAAGDLRGAAQSYRELYPAGTEAKLLPWLHDDLERACVYWAADGPLQPAIRHLMASEEALARGEVGRGDAELERRRAGFRLVEVLLDPQHADLRDPLEHYLVREAGPRTSLVGRLAALDAATDYLLVQDLPQRVPVGLVELVGGILFGPGSSEHPAELRAAAIATLGTIRTVEAFFLMTNVLRQDLTEEQSRLARGSYDIYRWLHYDLRTAASPTVGHDLHKRIGKCELESWGAALEKQARRYEPTSTSPVAWHLAWWEKDPEGRSPPRAPLRLSERLRTEVDAAHVALADTWSAGRTIIEAATSADTSHPYHRYLVTSGRFPQQYESAVWQPMPDEDCDVLLGTADGHGHSSRNTVLFGRDGAVALSGTVTRAVCRAGAVEAWESNVREGFLKLLRPGHSQLRVTSRVPEDAVRLRIQLTQMIGARSQARAFGTVAYRLRLAGRDWRCESIVGGSTPYGGGKEKPPTDWENGTTTSNDVPFHVLGDAKEIELAVEYLYGNTTWRLGAVELIWNPPEAAPK